MEDIQGNNDMDEEGFSDTEDFKCDHCRLIQRNNIWRKHD
jgi:hypothetical protein